MYQKKRIHGLDTLRGLTLVSMMAYHACWDLVYLVGKDWGWYRSEGAYLWQQSICWTFILLSGYCFLMGRKPWKRGAMAFGGGLLVTTVTLVAMPEEPAIWGVLTFLGSATLLTVPLKGLFLRLEPRLGLAGSFSLFLLLRDVNDGFLGFEGIRLMALPEELYRNLFTAWLGFPAAGFVSSDYFGLLPWIFLFWTGLFLYRLRPGEAKSGRRIPGITAMGRHSLLVYLLHQPVIYGVLMALYGI